MKIDELLSDCYILAQNLEGFGYHDVECHYDPTVFLLSKELEQKLPDVREQIKAKGGYDGDLFRLNSCRIENEKLHMYFSPVKFARVRASNAILNERLEDGLTVREKYVKDPRVLNDILANSVSTATQVITADNKAIFKKRADDLIINPGLFSNPVAGFLEGEDCLVNGVPNPFVNIRKEFLEELGVDIAPTDYKILGVVRFEPELRIDICGKTRVNLTSDEINRLYKREPEGEYVFVDLSVANLDLLMKERWSRTGKYGTFCMLASELGLKEVENYLEKLNLSN